MFIGEIVLVLAALFRPRDLIGRFSLWLATGSALSPVTLSILLLVLYGIAETMRGIALDHEPVVALQNLVLNYYPLYFFLGLGLADRRPDMLRRIVLVGAWAHGVYGYLYILGLSNVYIAMPGTPGVGVFGQPCGSTLFLFGLFCFPASPVVKIPAVLLNALTLIGVQARAEWLAFIAAFVVWGVLTRRYAGMLGGFGAIAALLAIGFVADVRLPGTDTRGGEVSSRSIVARIMAPVDSDIASEYASGSVVYKNTVDWRTRWWREIWMRVNDDPVTQLFGLGYGFPLGNLVPYLRNQVIRTPHNIFFYVFGYGGWMGVVVFFWFQFQLARLQWCVFKLTGQPFGLLVWMQTFIAAFFGNVFETPSWAIPTYVLLGMTAWHVAAQRSATAREAWRMPLEQGGDRFDIAASHGSTA